MMFRNILSKIHLWLGLASGLVVFVISVTGAIYVFRTEITEWQRHNAIYAEHKAGNVLPISELLEKAQKDFGPERKISWVNVYNNPDKSWVFFSYQSNPEALTYFGILKHYDAMYVDPYSGEEKAVYNEKYDFFNIVKWLHWSLLLRTPVGQPIVGWSTLIFVILLISGLILWWPKNWRRTKNIFRIKWIKTTSAYKRLYDLHNVLGFYSLILALIIALTGMIWSFKWFQALVYMLVAGTTATPDLSVMKSTPDSRAKVHAIDTALAKTREKYPDAAVFRMVPAADSLGVIQVFVQEEKGKYYKTDELQFDQYSGKVLKERKHADKNAGEKLITANYDIHVGAIGGIAGKIIAFIISLISASLPVTGFFMWLKRNRNRRKSLF
ncbi:PepSY domain-containing protein [Prolixibacter sp. NT017]|uniref:PepSY-associated TM helix domain-containing protein n=1 Tax=Prolixibacter sp. NT017 TaxID=2652390 RepID=UPI0012868FFF|nr:PepSY-associated TM helix domain-containing protein [Prolixibacter sp. NT017]GET24744.1 membrane protein [Prolixibacter sp. NT017]